MGDKHREKLLEGLTERKIMCFEKAYGENFFVTETTKKEKRKQGQRDMTLAGFADAESISIFEKIKASSKALKNDITSEIKRELGTAPMRIGNAELRNKALTHVLSAFATCV